MTDDARTVPLEEVGPGLLLAEDLVNDAGQVLVGCGTELTPKLCASLKKRGIEQLCVKPVTPALTLEQVRERLDKQFLHTEKNETMLALRNMLERFHSHRGAE